MVREGNNHNKKLPYWAYYKWKQKKIKRSRKRDKKIDK